MGHDDDRPQADAMAALVRSLTPEQRMLVVLKRELYDDDWQAMEDDLQARLAGGPYVFRLANRMEDDLQRIDQLRRIERQAGVNLADFVEA